MFMSDEMLLHPEKKIDEIHFALIDLYTKISIFILITCNSGYRLNSVFVKFEF